MTGDLNDLLKATSRSFYLTLRVLPARVRPQIGLAYLLARTTDTIADTELVPLAQRLEALQKLRERILGQSSAPLNFGALAQQQGSPAEKLLLEKVEGSLALLQSLSPEDLKLVRDSSRHHHERAGTGFTPVCGRSPRPEGDTAGAGSANHRAGNGGRTGRLHLPRGRLRGRVLDKDLPHTSFPERAAGRTAIHPRRHPVRQGLAAREHFARPAGGSEKRPLLPSAGKIGAGEFAAGNFAVAGERGEISETFPQISRQGGSHLRAGWNYTNTLPSGQFRVRLACAWPVLIGVKTIEKLRAADVMELQQRVKVSRGEVRGILLRSVVGCPFPGAWRQLFPQAEKLLLPAANWRKKTSCEFPNYCQPSAPWRFWRVPLPSARRIIPPRPPRARR